MGGQISEFWGRGVGGRISKFCPSPCWPRDPFATGPYVKNIPIPQSSVSGPVKERAVQIAMRGEWMVQMVGGESEDVHHRFWGIPLG